MGIRGRGTPNRLVLFAKALQNLAQASSPPLSITARLIWCKSQAISALELDWPCIHCLLLTRQPRRRGSTVEPGCWWDLLY
eukprot:834820-Pelagomonas_calceolata.AAC.1